MAVLLAERVAAQAGQREVGAVLLDRVEQSAQGVTRDSLIITLRQRVQILLNGGLGGCLVSAVLPDASLRDARTIAVTRAATTATASTTAAMGHQRRFGYGTGGGSIDG